MQNYKLTKYYNKIDAFPKLIYLNKILHYINNASNVQYGGLKINDIGSLMDFLKDKYKNDKTTKYRYLVILYGPPASGKQTSRIIACHMIKKYFMEELTTTDIYETFIDTSIDDITADVEINNTTVKNELIENMKKKLNNNITFDNAKNNINELAESSYLIYKAARPDYVSDLLYYFSVYINKNIFIETTGTDIIYLEKIINLLSYYKYIPILIYPFINDVNILFNRSINRGLKEGRFLQCKSPFGLSTQLKVSAENYPKIKEIILKYKKYLIYQYISNISENIFNDLKKFNFDNLDNLTLNFNYIIENNGDKYIERSIIEKTIVNYNDIMQLILECQ